MATKNIRIVQEENRGDFSPNGEKEELERKPEKRARFEEEEAKTRPQN